MPAPAGYYPAPLMAHSVRMKDGRIGKVLTVMGFWTQGNAYEVTVKFEDGSVSRVNVQKRAETVWDEV